MFLTWGRWNIEQEGFIGKIHDFVKDCVHRCYTCRISKHNHRVIVRLLQPIVEPFGRWEHLSVDLISELYVCEMDMIPSWLRSIDSAKKLTLLQITRPLIQQQQLLFEPACYNRGLPAINISDVDTKFHPLFGRHC